MPAVIGANPATLSKSVSSSSTAVALAAASTATTTRRAQSAGVLIKALSTNSETVYVGGSDVTTSNGYPLAASESVSLPIDDPSRIYIVGTSSTTVTVRAIYV